MSRECARAVIGSLNDRDIDRLRRLVDPEIVDEVLPVGSLHGRGEVIAFFEQMLAAFPDMHAHIEHVGDTDRATVVQWCIRGTFAGAPFLGLRPNGRRAEVRGVDVMEFADGLLVRNTIYYDAATLARHLGALPPVGSHRERATKLLFNLATRILHPRPRVSPTVAP